MYYRNATAAILVYDITDNSSFLQIKSWVDGKYLNCPDNCYKRPETNNRVSANA